MEISKRENGERQGGGRINILEMGGGGVYEREVAYVCVCRERERERRERKGN